MFIDRCWNEIKEYEGLQNTGWIPFHQGNWDSVPGTLGSRWMRSLGWGGARRGAFRVQTKDRTRGPAPTGTDGARGQSSTHSTVEPPCWKTCTCAQQATGDVLLLSFLCEHASLFYNTNLCDCSVARAVYSERFAESILRRGKRYI